MRRKTRIITIEAGPERKRIEIEVAADASEDEIMSAIGARLIDWKQIEEGRREMDTGGGILLDDILRELKETRGHAKGAAARKGARRPAKAGR